MAHGSQSSQRLASHLQSTMSNIAEAQPVAVNRKKQKRRQKQALKQAAQIESSQAHTLPNGLGADHVATRSQHSTQRPVLASKTPYQQSLIEPEEEDYDTEDDDDVTLAYSAVHNHGINGVLSMPSSGAATGKKKSRKKRKNKNPHADSNHHHAHEHSSHRPTAADSGKDRIWNTSTQEERERIKDFWQSLGENERKSLVKIEKDAVLKKMKEQQKHSCSCSLCGRKRNAIEEELEVLYDAYYDELEQYAYDVGPVDTSQAMPAAYDAAAAAAAAVDVRAPTRAHSHRTPIPLPSSRQAPEEAYGESSEAEDDELEYSDDYDEEDDYSQDSDNLRDVANDFLQLGNSLTVKGGILTVADDLLRNDGKKFIEMMEQMAERRMQRENEAHNQSQLPYAMHDHGPQNEYSDSEEGDEDYDSQEDDYDEEDELDETLTEKQRMEEGRRMFQIFAARMFEQRVLTAYREKVAAERQARLIEELEDEKSHDAQREAKKQRDAQKRKEKKQQQKQAKADDKARKEAEKKAEEEEARRIEAERQEEARRKREEVKKKKEAERKLVEAEKSKKEAERLRRQQEERERQQEAERKARELKAQRERAKDDIRRKAQEEQEVKEREAREREAKELDTKDRDLAAKREKKAEADKERRSRDEKADVDSERRTRDDKIRLNKAAAATVQRTTQDQDLNDKASPIAFAAASSAAAAERRDDNGKRTGQAVSVVAVPPSLQRSTSSVISPHIPVATPALPKAPTPVRMTASQQGSKGSSPKTPSAFTTSGKSASPMSSGSQQAFVQMPKSSKPPLNTVSPNIQHVPLTTSMPPGTHPGTYLGTHPGGLSGSHSGLHAVGFAGHPAMNSFAAHHPRPPGFADGAVRNGPPGLMFHNQLPPSGIGMPYPGSQTSQPSVGPAGLMARGFGDLGIPAPPPHHQHPIAGPPGFGHSAGQAHKPSQLPHGRQMSGSSNFENAMAGHHAQRPAPISRPGAVGRTQDLAGLGVDDLSTQLGSSALLDDLEESLPAVVPRNAPASNMSRAPAGSQSGFTSSGGIFAPSSQHQQQQHQQHQHQQPRVDPFSVHAGNSAVNNWTGAATAAAAFASPAMPQLNSWTTDRHWPTPSLKQGPGFGSNVPAVPSRARAVQIRIHACQICRGLTSTKATSLDGFIEVGTVLKMLEPAFHPPPTADEVLAICETEGTAHNGAANFSIQYDEPAERARIRLEMLSAGSGDGLSASNHGALNLAVGDVASPSVSNVNHFQHSHNGAPVAAPSSGMFPGLGANVGANTGFSM